MGREEKRVRYGDPRLADASHRAPRAGGPVAIAGTCIALALFVALCIGTSSASAAYLHSTPSESFGRDGTSATSFGFPALLAIYQAEGRLYERELNVGANNPGVYGFDLLNSHAPLGGNFPLIEQEVDGEWSSLAVDNSPSPTAGNIYYLTRITHNGPESDHILYGFDSDGNPLGGNFPVDLPEPLDVCSTAVDSNGHIWVADKTSSTIKEYASDGSPLSGAIELNSLQSAQPVVSSRPCKVAFDLATDDLYVGSEHDYDGNYFRYTAASNYQASNRIDPSADSIGGAVAFDSQHGVLYISRTEGGETGITAYNADGEVLDSFGSGSSFRGIAVDESTGAVYASDTTDFNERSIRVFPPSGIIPDVSTGDVTGTTLHADVDPVGGGDVTDCEFDYGTTANYGTSVPCEQATPYSSPTTVSATLAGLTPEVQYHYRARATNADGTYISVDRTFVPHHVVDLKTEPASGVSKSEATLNGSFSGTGLETHYYFEWGDDTEYGTIKPALPGGDAGSGVGPQNISVSLSNLAPGTTYHYRVVASNSAGTSVAQDRTFTTVEAVADVSTSVTNITGSSATLNGFWTGDGTDTHYYFEWGFTPQFGNVSAVPPGTDAGAGSGAQHVTFAVPDVLSAAVYHYRLVVSNSSGYTFGPDKTFKTPVRPAVAYLPPVEITKTSVKLTGTVNPRKTGDTTYHFEYGLTDAYGASTPEGASVGSDNVAHPVEAKITELLPGRTYHYRLVANSVLGGVAFGSDRTVTTEPNNPMITQSSISDVSGTKATLHASVRPGFGPTVVYFQFGPDLPYDSATLPVGPLAADDEIHQVLTTVDGLSPDTTYHYRAVASNFAGTFHGPDQTFETPGLPSVGATVVTNISQTSATLAGQVNPRLAATTFHFEYGSSVAYGSSTAESAALGADHVSHEVHHQLTGLSAGTTYHVRLVATNFLGQATGPDQTFTTAPEAVIPRTPRTCKKGQILKRGKCVKKRRKHRKHHKRRTADHG